MPDPDPRVVDQHHRQDDRARSARPPKRIGSPGKTTGREVIRSCSLAKVTIEPAKRDRADRDRERRRGEVEPRVVAAGVDDLLQLEQRDQRRRAAADAVEQRHHLRHLGHLHRAGAVHAADGADRDRDQDQRDVLEVEVGPEERHRARHDGRGGAEQVAVAGGLRDRTGP